MEHKRAAGNPLKMQPKQSECSFLLPRLVAAARGAHLERNRTSTFSMTGPRKEKGAGSGLVLDFTARERDCYGCFCERRFELAYSLNATRRLLTRCLPGGG